jgi:hypothetical protein
MCNAAAAVALPEFDVILMWEPEGRRMQFRLHSLKRPVLHFSDTDVQLFCDYFAPLLLITHSV